MIQAASNSSLKNCVIWGNGCTGQPSGGESYVNGIGGGGLAIKPSYNPVVENCLIYRNYSLTNGGGVAILGHSDPYQNPTRLDNCTIVNNTNFNLSGGGLYLTNISLCPVRNTIIYNNSAPAYPDVFTTNACLTNCCMSATNDWTAGRGNITNAPQFKNAAANNYRLDGNSPCINAGTNQSWMTNGVDLEGGVRIRYGTVDMGAYERIHEATIYNFH